MIEHQDTYLRDSYGREFSAQKKEDWEKAWNSPQMILMRKLMLQGERPAACHKCFALEDQKNISHRQTQNALYLSQKLLAPPFTVEVETSAITTLDLRPGNRCNLVCRMCNPETAQGWLPEWDKLHPGDLDASEKKLYKNLDWFKGVDLNEFPKLRRLNFGGGEPFIIADIALALRSLVQTGRAAHISLSFNTNLTVIPPWAQELFPHFQEVQLLVSLDGVGAVNDYIRYPSRFSEIEKNLHFIDQHFTQLGLSEVAILSTVQIYNLYYLPELFLFPKKFQHIKRDIYLNFLFDPLPFSIQALPYEEKRQAQEWLTSFAQKEDLLSAQDQEQLQGLLIHLFGHDLSSYFPEWRRQTNLLDQLRGQNVWQTLTKLCNLL